MAFLVTFCDGRQIVMSQADLNALGLYCSYAPPEDPDCCIISVEEYIPPPVYTCPYCGAIFASQVELDSHIASAHPSPPPSYLLTVNIDPAGAGGVELTPMGEYVSPGKVRYSPGTSVSMRAVFFGQVGQFDHWEGDASGTANPTTIVMNRDKTVTAVFLVGGVTYELTTSFVGSGAVYPSSGIYNPGDQIILSAIPASGWNFLSWSGDIAGCTPVPGMPNQLSVVMDRDRHIIANFQVAPAPPEEPEFRNLAVSYRKGG